VTDAPSAALLRELVPAVLGVLVRRGADFATAEDAVQEAVVAAISSWPAWASGTTGDDSDPPDDPKGWLVTVAWRKFLDLARSDVARRGREERLLAEPAPGLTEYADDTLEMYFLCAHPALTSASAVALTLRAVGGLTTRQIAAAYLVPEPTMGMRISRAKRAVSDVRFDRSGELGTVLTTLYLVFNEGYSGDVDLAAEAIRLTRRLAAFSDDAEVSGLLALMLLHYGRRDARTRADGSVVPLAEQDRTRWDGEMIAEGVDLLQAPSIAMRSARTSHWPRSPPCTPMRAPSRRPTGCRSSSGTTSCSTSRTVRSSDSTVPSRSVRQTEHERDSPPSPRSTL
jgi:predicted RNA polymerase sigma factor